MHFHPMRNKGGEEALASMNGTVVDCEDPNMAMLVVGPTLARRSDVEAVAQLAVNVSDRPVEVQEKGDAAIWLSVNSTFHIPAGVEYNFVNLSK